MVLYDMIGNVQELTNYGIGNIIIILLLLLIIGDQLWDLVGKFLARFFNFHTRWSKREEEKKMIKTHEETIKQMQSEMKKTNDAMVAIIRKDIVNECKRLQKENVSTISASDYETLDGLFKNYFRLGGNHVVSKLYEWFKTLKIDLDE